MNVTYCDVCGAEARTHRRVSLTIDGKVARQVDTCGNDCWDKIEQAFLDAAPGPGRDEQGRVGREKAS